jgi:hypothetical protein
MRTIMSFAASLLLALALAMPAYGRGMSGQKRPPHDPAGDRAAMCAATPGAQANCEDASRQCEDRCGLHVTSSGAVQRCIHKCSLDHASCLARKGC